MHKDTQESSTTGSFPVAQFDSGQKLYEAFGNVPVGVIRRPPLDRLVCAQEQQFVGNP